MPNDIFEENDPNAQYEYEVEVLGGKYVCPITGEVYKKGQAFTTGIDLSGFRNKFRIIAKKIKKVVEQVVEKVVETVVDEGGKALEELLSEPTPEPEKKPTATKKK